MSRITSPEPEERPDLAVGEAAADAEDTPTGAADRAGLSHQCERSPFHAAAVVEKLTETTTIARGHFNVACQLTGQCAQPRCFGGAVSGRSADLHDITWLSASDATTSATFHQVGAEHARSFRRHPTGTGIIHQINMESPATAVWTDHSTEPTTLHPDTLVATDSHTPIVNSIRLTGRLRPGVTGTDPALTLTAMRRAQGVVDTFVEFHGDGARQLPWADRAAVSKMAPEDGATVALFPTDKETLRFLDVTGPAPAHTALIRECLTANQLLLQRRRPTPRSTKSSR